MKVISQTPAFQPVKVELTFESTDEIKAVVALLQPIDSGVATTLILKSENQDADTMLAMGFVDSVHEALHCHLN